jgi:hypothetical protein
MLLKKRQSQLFGSYYGEYIHRSEICFFPSETKDIFFYVTMVRLLHGS